MKEAILKRWEGFTEEYNNYRPVVPNELILTLKRMAGNRKPELVVDLGCGTGISTRAWIRHAEKIIGIEPSGDMLDIAEKKAEASNISFIHCFSDKILLNEKTADIVCAASSIHWMEPYSTLSEVKRILKEDGLFSFFGPSHPPVTPFLELDQAYFDFERKLTEFNTLKPETVRWKWTDHLLVIKEKKLFNHQRLFFIDQKFSWNSNDYINWLMTTNQLPALLETHDQHFMKLFNDFISKIRLYFGKKKHVCFFVYKVYAFKNSYS